MNEEEIESFFKSVNYVEDTIINCEKDGFYYYVLDCIMSNKHCDIDSYKKYLKKYWGG